MPGDIWKAEDNDAMNLDQEERNAAREYMSPDHPFLFLLWLFLLKHG